MYYFILLITLLLTDAYLLLNRNLWISFLFTLIVFIGFIFLRHTFLKGFKGFIVFTSIMILIVIFTPAPKKLKHATYEGAKPTAPVTVQEGSLIGVYNKDESVEVYAGIPYAQAPIGNLRWKEPQTAKAYDGILKADHFAPMAMQKTTPQILSSLSDILIYKNFNRTIQERYTPIMSEDCLYLNIWKPAGKKEKLPVVFYIHGGSLTTGQAWWQDYNGESYAKEDVIFVTFTYRLGALGFYADENLQAESANRTTGMYGFLDQIKALQWVNDNIASFGGDPDQITIAGESAGSSSVNAMCTSPLTKGLFKYAIGESSSITAQTPAHSYMDITAALQQGMSLREEMHAYTLDELRNLPAEKIINTNTVYGTINALTNDGYALAKSPYESYMMHEQNELALLTGYNENDGDFFMLLNGNIRLSNYKEKIRENYPEIADELLDLYPAENNAEAKTNFLKIYNAYAFGYGYHMWSELATKNEPVYRYYFTRKNNTIGSNHTGELFYAYGTTWTNPSAFTAEDKILENTMMKYWLNFIKTGNPNDARTITWHPYQNNCVLELNTAVQMIEDPNAPLYQLFDKSQ